MYGLQGVEGDYTVTILKKQEGYVCNTPEVQSGVGRICSPESLLIDYAIYKVIYN